MTDCDESCYTSPLEREDVCLSRVNKLHERKIFGLSSANKKEEINIWKYFKYLHFLLCVYSVSYSGEGRLSSFSPSRFPYFTQPTLAVDSGLIDLCRMNTELARYFLQRPVITWIFMDDFKCLKSLQATESAGINTYIWMVVNLGVFFSAILLLLRVICSLVQVDLTSPSPPLQCFCMFFQRATLQDDFIPLPQLMTACLQRVEKKKKFGASFIIYSNSAYICCICSRVNLKTEKWVETDKLCMHV